MRHGVDVPLVITHDDDPGERIWFDRVADVAAARGIACIAPADPNAPPQIITPQRCGYAAWTHFSRLEELAHGSC